MSKKKIIAGLVVLAIIIAGIYAWNEYHRTAKDLSKVKADITVDAATLINRFLENETAAYNEYRDKILAVKGAVKKVEAIDNTYTVVIGDINDMSSVRCLVDSSYAASATALQTGATITMKGAFTGFKKDETGLLGSDVELNRCVVEE